MIRNIKKNINRKLILKQISIHKVSLFFLISSNNNFINLCVLSFKILVTFRQKNYMAKSNCRPHLATIIPFEKEIKGRLIIYQEQTNNL